MADSGYGEAAVIGGAGLLSGLISAAGQIYANRQNRKYQQALNALSVDLSNTAHQREVLDLQAAGLNPILSASSSGSSVPTLTASDFSNPGEGLSSGISSATRAFDFRRQRNIADSQVAVNSATAENLVAQNANLRKQNQEIDARIANTDADTALKKIQAEIAPYKGHITSEFPGIRYSLSSAWNDLKGFGSSAVSFGRSAYDSSKELVKKLSDMKIYGSRAGARNAPARGSSSDGFRPGRIDNFIRKAFTPPKRNIAPMKDWYWTDKEGKKHYYLSR